MTCAPRLVDLRHEQPAAAPRSLIRMGSTVQRDVRELVGITLHQTAITYGVSDRQLRAAGGDRQLARDRRALGIPAHAVVFTDGTVVIPHAITAYVYHGGHAFNAAWLGVEIEGIYPGLEDDPETTPREDRMTTWGPREPMVLDETTIVAARFAVEGLCQWVRDAGGKLTQVVAHRQGSARRRADPGEAIWREVGLWARDTLGLEAPMGKRWRDGRPIPEAWGGPTGITY